MFEGQVITGGVLSVTVTVNVQEGPPAAVAVTVVVPTGKKDPDGCEYVTGPHKPVVVAGG
jgi:hypothetical protein